jgi:hypothetical protein
MDDQKTIDLRVFAMAMEARYRLWVGILDGTIPSMVSDTGATSRVFLKGNQSIPGMVSSCVVQNLSNTLHPGTNSYSFVGFD